MNKYVERLVLKKPGCRSQFIKNICTFRANIAIGKTDASKLTGSWMSTTPPWHWDLQRAVRDEM